jgi:uncharacterized membrane protein YfcA
MGVVQSIAAVIGKLKKKAGFVTTPLFYHVGYWKISACAAIKIVSPAKALTSTINVWVVKNVPGLKLLPNCPGALFVGGVSLTLA